MAVILALVIIWCIFLHIKLNDIENILNKLKSDIKKDIFLNSNKKQEVNEIKIPDRTPPTSLIEEFHFEQAEKAPSDNTIQNIKTENKTEIKPQNNFDFENAFLGNIFNKIGAIAIVIGFCIFLKLIGPYVLTPLVRVVGGFIAGFLMIFVSLKLRTSQNMKNYSEVLAGVGFAILFIVVFCAMALYNMFNEITALIIAGLILASGCYCSEKQKTLSMIVVSLFGGYLTAIFTKTSLDFIFCYLIFLNLMTLIFTYRNPNREAVNFINLLLTFLIVSLKNLFHSNINPVYPIILWVIYLTYDIIRKRKNIETIDKNNILNYLNFSILTLFSISIFGYKEKILTGCLLIVASVIYSILVQWFLNSKPEYSRCYAHSLLAALFFALYFIADKECTIALWSIGCIVLCSLARWCNLSYLTNWGLIYLFAASCALFSIDKVIYTKHIVEYHPIINIRLFMFIFPVVSALISYLILKKSVIKENLSHIFKFVFITLSYLYINFELNDFITSISALKISHNFMKIMTFIIIGFMYSVMIKRMYTIKRIEFLNVVSLTIAMLAFFALFIYGYSYKPIDSFIPVLNIRFLAFMASIIWAIVCGRYTKLEIYKYLTVTLTFLLIHTECSDILLKYDFDNFGYLISVLWAIYAGIIMTFGIFKNIKYLKNTGIWITIAAIFKVFIIDLAGIEATFKVLAFLTLGFVLMIVAYFYNKK